MSEIIFNCRRHGDRTEDQVYRSNDKATLRGFRYKCRECTYAATAKRPCKIHGNVPAEQRLKSGKCQICSLSFMRAMNDKRNNNREEFNLKQQLKRNANPEKFKKKYKEEYKRSVAKYGKEFINDTNIANKLGITYEQYHHMFIKQANKCDICNQPESRIFTDRTTKEIKIAKLCLDHSHETGKVRALLCHDCNTMIGKAKEDINILQSAIQYLKKFQNKPE